MDAALTAHLHDWLNLLLRWAHFITGVAWIGASFYFNWLENHLERQSRAAGSDSGIAGDLWAVHGGGFYYLQKYEVAPPKLPTTLHWFKYEAYFTWLTGFVLLCSLYYFNASAYMIDPGVADIGPGQAVIIGLASLVLSWLFYDALCRSALSEKGLMLGLVIFTWFAFLAWTLSSLLSGRAAYIHVGAAIGTIMVANVAHVIIPAQRDMVDALSAGQTPDGAKGKNALLRSRHNNYLTLPVLFITISNHYPATYGNSLNWLVLVVIAIAGVGVRHFFNVRHLEKYQRWVLPVSLLLLLVAVYMTRPVIPDKPAPADSPVAEAGAGTAEPSAALPVPVTADVMPIIQQRCAGCHSSTPTQPGFPVPPLGVALDSPEEVEKHGPRIFGSVVTSRTMPLANLTKMTAQERDTIARWYAGRVRNQ